jgi:hypothetical protein
MDLHKAIQDLLEEKGRLDRAIQSLESLLLQGKKEIADLSCLKNRRGRTSMGEQERKMVSERMKRYWDSRRKQ